MKSLEARIPPPAIAAVVAIAMWAISRIAPLIQVPAPLRTAVAIAIALVGMGFALTAILSFRRASTTVKPTKPQATSSLVISGVYRVTRNPMYLGLLFVLVAWAVALSSPWALLGPVAFVLYIRRFQIVPEERALAALFGSEYSAYRSRVRRWL
jgi:protein-S-isoprenylcysteine O-methyltransferase Ste14